MIPYAEKMCYSVKLWNNIISDLWEGLLLSLIKRTTFLKFKCEHRKPISRPVMKFQYACFSKHWSCMKEIILIYYQSNDTFLNESQFNKMCIIRAFQCQVTAYFGMHKQNSHINSSASPKINPFSLCRLHRIPIAFHSLLHTDYNYSLDRPKRIFCLL